MGARQTNPTAVALRGREPLAITTQTAPWCGLIIILRVLDRCSWCLRLRPGIRPWRIAAITTIETFEVIVEVVVRQAGGNLEVVRVSNPERDGHRNAGAFTAAKSTKPSSGANSTTLERKLKAQTCFRTPQGEKRVKAQDPSFEPHGAKVKGNHGASFSQTNNHRVLQINNSIQQTATSTITIIQCSNKLWWRTSTHGH